MLVVKLQIKTEEWWKQNQNSSLAPSTRQNNRRVSLGDVIVRASKISHHLLRWVDHSWTSNCLNYVYVYIFDF